ncbi:MAG: carbohydrate ABC transporter permease [Gemmiger sp.]|nr:carbohydrate ABC transporter permease [Gemmiger sp.]
MTAKEKAWNIAGKVFVYGMLSLLFLITFLPFWNIFVLSINEASDTLRGGVALWPRAPTFDSYITVLKDPEIIGSLGITLLRTVVGVPFSVIIIAMLAYGLSRNGLVGKRAINFFFVFTMMFSGGMIPKYMVIRSLGLLDNFWVFILPDLVNIFWMMLIRTYMEGLPRELEESARIDGANDLVIFLRVILPICVPVLATVIMFSAIYHWNSWYDSYIYTSSQNLKTLSSVLVKILNQYQTGGMLSQAQQMAASAKRLPVSSESIRMTVTMVATLPIVMVYPLVQKYFISGMMVGSVKD